MPVRIPFAPEGRVVETAAGFLARLTGDGPLLVAVSGGGDSTALLLALHAARGRFAGLGRPIVAATVDHGLRREAKGEAEAVARLCARLGVPHHILAWSGPKPAAGLQAAARMARYRLLVGLAEARAAVAVATAHTADDQAETVAMRAARQPTLHDARGLAGMAEATLFSRSTWILRPFLGLGRDDLRRFLADGGEDWIDDPSNADPRFERVRIRQAGADLRAGAVEAAQAARRQLSARTADMLAARGRVAGGIVPCLDIAAASTGAAGGADPAMVHAAATLAALAGGRAHLPPAAATAGLATLLSSEGPRRFTLSRAVVTRRAQALLIHRERRLLPSLTIEPGSEALWDNRYRIVNHGAAPMRLRGARPEEAAGALPAGQGCVLPSHIWRAALEAEPMMVQPGATAEPVFSSESGKARGKARHFALFDVFLPSFDLTLANRCATLFGCEGYGLPPLSGA